MKKEGENPEQQPVSKVILEFMQYDCNNYEKDYTLEHGPDLLHYIS